MDTRTTLGAGLTIVAMIACGRSAFGCVRDLTQRAGAQQPARGPSEATQPFGKAPNLTPEPTAAATATLKMEITR